VASSDGGNVCRESSSVVMNAWRVVVAMNARRGRRRWWKRMWDEAIVCGASGCGGIAHSLSGGDGYARMMRCSAFWLRRGAEPFFYNRF
jgi:hypothetical protein